MCVTGSDKLLRGNQIDWVIQWVSWFQVFCKEIKSNAVSKLFILVWSYEGMKVLDLGYENSYENFSITPICHIFSNFPEVFCYTQGMNRQVWNMDLTHLGRTHHICGLLACMYWPEKFCVQGLVLSVHMYVMVFQDQHTLPKWNILSLLCTSKQLDRIFHFVRVCWSWKTITYIRAERTRPWTQNFSDQYRHIERESSYH